MSKKKKLQKETAELKRQLEDIRSSIAMHLVLDPQGLEMADLSNDLITGHIAAIEPDSTTLVLKQENHRLRVEKVELEEQNSKLAEQVKDLEERLQNIFRWEDRSRKQEILTLKKDISASLKLDHADYIVLLKEPLSNEAYEFSKATLTHIFRILKRFDVTF